MKINFLKITLISLFITIFIFSAFGYGLAMGVYQLYPYKLIRAVKNELEYIITSQLKPHYLSPARFDKEGVIINKKDAFNGYTIITGIWKKNGDIEVKAKLLDMQGNKIHSWVINDEVWKKVGINKQDRHIHGTYLFPNGDLLLNIEYGALVKLDKNSNPLWISNFATHHSIFRDDEGNFWVPGLKNRQTETKELPFFPPIFNEDYIFQINPNGNLIQEISLPKVLIDSNYKGLLRIRPADVWSSPYEKAYFNIVELHLNKILVFTEESAKHFPQFEQGDILVSMRDLSTVAVIDKKTQRIKWSLTHPFFYQHDPILTEDGKILVFNNNLYDKELPLDCHNGSQILEVDPQTKEVIPYYCSSPENLFYTPWGGKQQLLPNGNLLITEAVPGRVFEINPDKEIVWEWINEKWDDTHVSEIMEGRRYPKEYLEFLNDKDSEKQETKNPQKSE